MKKIFLVIIFTVIYSLFLFSKVESVRAGSESCTSPSYPVCWPTRIIEQWSCDSCNVSKNVCTNPLPNIIECNDPSLLGMGCAHWGLGSCMPICVDTDYIGNCKVLDVNVACNVSPGSCNWTGDLDNCQWSGGTCSDPGTQTTLSCCGPRSV